MAGVLLGCGSLSFRATWCVSVQESELLRLQAFHLFGTLAKVVRISKKHLFKEEVRRAWVPLLLHCQDPCPDAAQVRRSPGFGPQSRGCSSQKGKCFLGPLAQPPVGSPTTPGPSPLSHPAPLMSPEATCLPGKGTIQGDPQTDLWRSLSFVGAVSFLPSYLHRLPFLLPDSLLGVTVQSCWKLS